MRTNERPLDNTDIFTLLAQAFSLRPLGHDAFESSATPAYARSSTPSGGVVSAAPARRSWLARIDDWLWKQEQRDIEAYLAQSKDVYDLEARIRELERGVPSRYY